MLKGYLKFILFFLLTLFFHFNIYAYERIKDSVIRNMKVGDKIITKVINKTFIVKKNKVVIGQNFSFKKDISADGVHFIRCNFTQKEPFTKLNIRNSVFESCNLVNVELDPSNKIIDCNITQRKIEETSEGTITTYYDRKTKKVMSIIREKKIQKEVMR